MHILERTRDNIKADERFDEIASNYQRLTLADAIRLGGQYTNQKHGGWHDSNSMCALSAASCAVEALTS